MVNVDPAKTAVVILDLQNAVIHDKGAFGAAAHARQQNVVANTPRLADTARSPGARVIHVHHQRSVGADSRGRLQAERAPVAEHGRDRRDGHRMVGRSREPQPGDIVLQKQRVSALYGTPPDIRLRGLGAEKVLVSGALTNLSVESTTRYGADLGYEMVLVQDACSSFDDWHRAAVEFAVTARRGRDCRRDHRCLQRSEGRLTSPVGDDGR
jgi:gluconolactonase